MSEKKECSIEKYISNMTCEMKLVYILILILLVCNIFIFAKLFSCSASKQNKAFKEFIDNNPRVILDSVQRFVDKEQAEAQKKQQEQVEVNVKKNIDRIRDEKHTGVANPDGTKVVVEFFDYNCGYCKMGSKAIESIVKKDPTVKVIFRDFPIFGGMSMEAAKYSVAVAITTPSKYLDFHSALMASEASSIENIENALKEAKISVDRVKRTLKTRAEDIEKRLNENRRLGEEIGIRGTPAFLIGDEFIPGYVDETTILEKLK